MTPRLALLLSVLAVISLAGGWLLGPASMPSASTEVAGGSLAFPALAAQLPQAARVEIRRGDQAVTIVRGAGGADAPWGLAERGLYPVRPKWLHELLADLTELRLAEKRTADVAQFPRLGVEDPGAEGTQSTLLRVLDGQGGVLAELVVGHARESGRARVPDSVYVRFPGQGRAWLAEGKLVTDIDPTVWLEPEIANVAADRVATVATRRGVQALVFGAAGDGFDLTFPAEHPALDPKALRIVRSALQSLRLYDVRRSAASTGEPLGGATLTTTDGLTVTASLFRDGGGIWGRFDASGTGSAADEAARLHARWAGWTFQLADYKEKAFVPVLADLVVPAPATAPVTQ